ncbi:MAG: hypothetical protein LBT38_03360 [Deltaproteobacteria bacterium]|jgi:hypothetical protein|nr:hypothetical protein [Deltaproteobacteria bacterium]
MLWKKILIPVLAALAWAFLLYTPPLLAQDPDLEEITIAELNAEGPLTQADIDIYLKFLEHAGAALKNPPPSDIEGFMKKMTAEFLKANDVKPVRLRLITEKIPYAVMVASDTEGSFEPTDTYMELSQEEVDLVSDNMDKIQSFMKTNTPS